MISDLLRPQLADPAARFTAAAMVGVRHKGGNPDQKRDRLRISMRLACGLTPAQVESTLTSTARSMPVTCYAGCGAGLADATRAVSSLGGSS